MKTFLIAGAAALLLTGSARADPRNSWAYSEANEAAKREAAFQLYKLQHPSPADVRDAALIEELQTLKQSIDDAKQAADEAADAATDAKDAADEAASAATEAKDAADDAKQAAEEAAAEGGRSSH